MSRWIFYKLLLFLHFGAVYSAAYASSCRSSILLSFLKQEAQGYTIEEITSGALLPKQRALLFAVADAGQRMRAHYDIAPHPSLKKVSFFINQAVLRSGFRPDTTRSKVWSDLVLAENLKIIIQDQMADVAEKIYLEYFANVPAEIAQQHLELEISTNAFFELLEKNVDGALDSLPTSHIRNKIHTLVIRYSSLEENLGNAHHQVVHLTALYDALADGALFIRYQAWLTELVKLNKVFAIAQKNLNSYLDTIRDNEFKRIEAWLTESSASNDEGSKP